MNRIRIKVRHMIVLAVAFFFLTSQSFAQEAQSGPPIAPTMSAPTSQGAVIEGPPSTSSDSSGNQAGTIVEAAPPPPGNGMAAPESQTSAKTEGSQNVGKAMEKGAPEPLQRFGRDFFTPARKRILEMENRIINGQSQLPSMDQRDALSGFVGPLEMVTSSVYATIPQRYILSPGDRATVFYWGKMLDLQKIPLVVDENGDITLPQIGKLSVRGMTLDQFQNNLKTALARVTVKDLELIATLDRLKSIQIFITGEAFRPGSYAISAVTTLFNALYAGGGPSDLGSLRDIRLLRNQQVVRIDFYDYLLHGESQNDIPLQPGDTLFIPQAVKAVSVSGEVNRPGVYELKEGENLKRLIELAGGIKTTGVLQKVLIRSLSPNKERIVKEVSVTEGQAPQDPPLYDGDSVWVYPILPDIVNNVTLEGKVERPGTYELKEGMRVADLFSEINHPLGEAYLDRADILRLNEDRRTTTLIPVDLGKALAGDPVQNIRLAWMDRVIVYSKFDVQFIPPRVVTIHGAVQRPGDYGRSDAMTVKDLLVKAGGLLPDVYAKRADLLRYDFEKEMTTIIPVDLEKVLAGEASANIPLADKDLLRIYSLKESQFTPPHAVAVYGAVQRPGDYERSEDMTLGDLLVKAGGLLPNVYAERADLLRYDFEKEMTTIIPVDLRKVMAGDTSANILLADKDLLRIYSLKESQFTPPHNVTIFGAVQRPSSYSRSAGMRLKDLLFAAGGPLPGYYEKMEVARARSESEVKIMNVDLSGLLQGDETQNILLEDEDIVMVKKKSDFFDRPLFITIDGEVKYPGTYSLRTRRDKISDLVQRAGGLTELAYPRGAVFTRKKEYVPSGEQRSDLALVNQVINVVNDLEYERQVARNKMLWLQEQAGMASVPLGTVPAPILSGGSASEAAAVGMAPVTAQTAGQTVGGIIGSMESLPSVVSKPRKFGDSELQSSGRMIMDLPEALSDPGSKDDLVLMEGDTLKVPTHPMAVNVIGAVIRPTVIAYDKKKKWEEYVNLAGGFTEDAHKDKALVLRLDGTILPMEEADRIEEGDIIYIPPKVMSLEIVERIDKIIEVVKFTLVTAASVGTFIYLVGLFVP